MRAPRHPRRGVRRARSRSGFTLVELMVAMMILAVGVLGLAATAGSVTRNMAGGRRNTIAANVAASRLERLRANPCTTLTSGTDTVRGIVSVWDVAQVPRGVAITETVTFRTPQGRLRVRVYKTTIPC